MSDVVLVALVATIVPLVTQLVLWDNNRRARAKTNEKIDIVASNVNGHLSRLTAELAGAATTNTALTVENDRLNEGTTTVPVAQTPAAGAHVTREANGAITVTDRRKPE